MKTSYQRPSIETMQADRILELLGPVSCGSNGGPDFNASGMRPLGAR